MKFKKNKKKDETSILYLPENREYDRLINIGGLSVRTRNKPRQLLRKYRRKKWD